MLYTYRWESESWSRSRCSCITIPSTLHQKLVLWDEDGRIEEIKADDSPYYVDQINVNFKEYHASVKPLEINMSTFDPSLIKGCYVGTYDMKLVPKTKESLAKPST
ncbi:hypothetical protein PIB30_089315 [Stylosanthes scabra]|uniref:Uncharacterized protein n=1 Tax=Stylosanthes scabra TaxID=79078 RepID=A0ABU6WTZ0_9FABA|nr:hypothetical protein [Stylosanthes scabra]